jgi:hypothetical protein
VIRQLRGRVVAARLRRDARATYFAQHRPAVRAARALCRERDAAARAELLDALAGCERRMADVHPAAFGPDPIEWEGGRDLAESLEFSADLAGLLADTERAAAAGPGAAQLRLYASGHLLTLATCWGLEPPQVDALDLAADEVMWQLVTVTDPQRRAWLVLDLYDLVVDTVGGQAAETLAGLAGCYLEAAGHSRRAAADLVRTRTPASTARPAAGGAS